jgi:hypothetical protein
VQLNFHLCIVRYVFTAESIPTSSAVSSASLHSSPVARLQTCTVHAARGEEHLEGAGGVEKAVTGASIAMYEDQSAEPQHW